MFTLIDIIVLVIIIIAVILAIFTVCTYTGEGNISCFGIPEITKLREKYFSNNSVEEGKDKIVARLHELLIYQKEKVRWHHTLATSLLLSLGVLYAIRSLTIRNYLITIIFIFLAIEIPRRWVNTHENVTRAAESTLLRSLYVANK